MATLAEGTVTTTADLAEPPPAWSNAFDTLVPVTSGRLGAEVCSIPISTPARLYSPARTRRPAVVWVHPGVECVWFTSFRRGSTRLKEVNCATLGIALVHAAQHGRPSCERVR